MCMETVTIERIRELALIKTVISIPITKRAIFVCLFLFIHLSYCARNKALEHRSPHKCNCTIYIDGHCATSLLSSNLRFSSNMLWYYLFDLSHTAFILSHNLISCGFCKLLCHVYHWSFYNRWVRHLIMSTILGFRSLPTNASNAGISHQRINLTC